MIKVNSFLIIIFSLLMFSCNFFEDKINYNDLLSGPGNMELNEACNFLSKIPNSTIILGVGEPVHGSREINELRFKCFKYLVKNNQYNLFLVEGDFGSILPLSDYVANGKGDPKLLLKQSGYWIWNNTELLQIVEWMRAYNSNPLNTTKLSFYGIDMKQSKSILRYICKLTLQCILT